MIEDIKGIYGLKNVPFGLMQKLSRIPKKKVPEFFVKHSKGIHKEIKLKHLYNP